MLNVPRAQIENFINLTFVTNSDRVSQAIFDIAPTQDNPYIPRNKSKELNEYLLYVISRMDRINKRKQFLEEKFHELFPFVQLPKIVIQKILFNRNQRIDINSFFQLTYKLIGYDEKNHIPEETIKPVNKIISYLTSTLNSSNLESFKEELDFRDEKNQKVEISDGQAVVIAMLNEDQKKRSANILLKFLYDQSKSDNPAE